MLQGFVHAVLPLTATPNIKWLVDSTSPFGWE
jgi:hypothetical protein